MRVGNEVFMRSLVKSALKIFPPFAKLVRDRDQFGKRLVEAETEIQKRNATLAEADEELRRLKDQLTRYQNGRCFQSPLIHHAHLTPSERAQLFRGYAHEAEYKQWIERVQSFTLVTYDGLISIADQVRYCEENNLEGCYVEAGTWKGGCAAMMALANLRFGKQRRKLYLFDSFQGIPEPKKEKDDLAWIRDEMHLAPADCNGALRSIGCLVGPRQDLEEVVFNIAGYPKSETEIVAGWFQDTVPDYAPRIGPIAILRLDGDLYDSIKVCLENLYPMLIDGGFLVIDDWCLSGAREAVTEYFAKQPNHPYMCYADGTVRYFIKR